MRKTIKKVDITTGSKRKDKEEEEYVEKSEEVEKEQEEEEGKMEVFDKVWPMKMKCGNLRGPR